MKVAPASPQRLVCNLVTMFRTRSYTYNEDSSTCVVHNVTNLLGFREGTSMSQSLTSKLLSWFIALLVAFLASVGLIFLALAIQRSTLPYNSEGNYFDGVVNYHEQSVEVYGVLFVVSFLAAIILFGIRLLVLRKANP